MAYQIYITDAIVCGSKNNNTSDRSYLLFTRDAGMVWASAKSAREERSKHRYALQDFSLARVSLVRGKIGWRVTGAEPTENLYFKAETRDTRTLIRNILRLLRRFLHGESPHPEVFDDVRDALQKQQGADTLRLESLLTLRVLSRLGYIAPQKAYDALLAAPYAHTIHREISKEEQVASDEAIAHALQISHL